MAADTKLQEGVRYGDSNLVESALEEGADPNAIGLYGWSTMHEAASNGDIEVLEVLLQFKGDPNGKDDLEGCTPVHYAAREGHGDCLRALLKAGGRYDIENNQGNTALDDAAEECRHILDKEKTKDYLNMTLDVARSTIAKNQSQDTTAKHKTEASKSSGESKGQRSGSSDELSQPGDQSGRITPRAWNSIKQSPEIKKTSDKESISGSLQLSFEYNSKSKTFKIRVWALQDVLLPPAEFSNLSRIYIKSHLLPDKKGETKRKTDEIRIDDPTKMNNSLVTLRRKGTRDSFKAVFLPTTFKFSKALEYENVTKEEVETKTVHVAVCVRQRYSTKTIPVANIQLSMKEAVRKLIKEKYALHSCIHYSMPDNIHAYDPHDIVVISEGMYSNRTTSHPTLRTKSRSSLESRGLEVSEDAARASSDINLKAVRCHSVESVPSTVVDVQSQQETSLDDLLEVSVEKTNSAFIDHSKQKVSAEKDKSANFDTSRRKVTIVDIHEAPSPPTTPLPGFTEDGELTDVSVVSSTCQSSDSAIVDLGGVETLDLNREVGDKKFLSSTPMKSERSKNVRHGFANPHITIVDDNDGDDEVINVSVDKGDIRRSLLDKKDAVIDIGSGDHGEETKKRGIRSQLFKKKDKRKKSKGDGMVNPGYVVDMRTGQKSLLGQFGKQGDEKEVGLEMLEILSDEEADALFTAKESHKTSTVNMNTKVLTSLNNNIDDTSSKGAKLKETVIDVGTTSEVGDVKKRTRAYDVHGAMKKEALSSKAGKNSSRGRDIDKERILVDGTPPRQTDSPVPVIHIECVDEIDRSISPGNKSPRLPRSPRQMRKISPMTSISTEGRRSTQQAFPPPVTRGLPHTDLSNLKSKDKLKNRGEVVPSDRIQERNEEDQLSPSPVDVQYVTETDNQYTSPKMRNKPRSPQSNVRRTRETPPGKTVITETADNQYSSSKLRSRTRSPSSHENQSVMKHTDHTRSREKSPNGISLRGETPNRMVSGGKTPGRKVKGHKSNEEGSEFEMLTLWNDEEWRKKLATPEFKLQMFQRTNQDPHPSTPLLQKYHGTDAMLAAASNPAFVPETPPNTEEGRSPSGKVDTSKRSRKVTSLSKDLGSSKLNTSERDLGRRDELGSSITVLNQTSL